MAFRFLILIPLAVINVKPLDETPSSGQIPSVTIESKQDIRGKIKGAFYSPLFN